MPLAEWRCLSGNLPHPTPLRGATFSRKREKGKPYTASSKTSASASATETSWLTPCSAIVTP